MSFRQFGGLNYAPKHNIVGSNYNSSNNLLVSQNVGQSNSYINFLSDISGNIMIYGDFDINGDLGVRGDVDISGNTSISGNLSVTETITANGGTLTGMAFAGVTTYSNSIDLINYKVLTSGDFTSRTNTGNQSNAPVMVYSRGQGTGTGFCPTYTITDDTVKCNTSNWVIRLPALSSSRNGSIYTFSSVMDVSGGRFYLQSDSSANSDFVVNGTYWNKVYLSGGSGTMVSITISNILYKTTPSNLYKWVILRYTGAPTLVGEAFIP
jgi:hypothetical protein